MGKKVRNGLEPVWHTGTRSKVVLISAPHDMAFFLEKRVFPVLIHRRKT